MPSHTRARSALRRGLLAAAVLAAAGAASASIAAGGIAAGAEALPRTGTSAPASSLSLLRQTSWVGGSSRFSLAVRVRSSLPTSQLGLRFVLYSRLTSRSAFEESLSGTEAQSELPIDTPATIPLGALERRAGTGGSLTVSFPVSTAPSAAVRPVYSPTLALDCGDLCDGVYPLRVVLVDSTDGGLLASLTTHLVYTAGTAGALRLRVALVLPAGTEVALGANGSSLLDRARLDDLASLLATVDAAPRVALTVQWYPQLLVALERDRSRQARAVLASFVSQFGTHGGKAPVAREALGAPFAPVDVAALAAAHLGGELSRQLARGRAALGPELGAAEPPSPYVAYGPIGDRSLELLETAGVRDLVLPTGSATVTAGTPQPTVALTSPVGLVPAGPAATRGSSAGQPGSSEQGASGTRSGAAAAAAPRTTALLADPGLASHFSGGPSSSVLRAHQLLADLAEIYFDAPSDRDPRGVVVAPRSFSPDTSFLATVLSGLSSSPVLTSRTLAGEFSGLPVGGNGAPRVEQLASGTAHVAHGLGGRAVLAARASLAVLGSVLPDDHTLLAHLGDSILLAESDGLSRAARRRFEGAPSASYRLIDDELSISGGRTVTLTSRTGQIPVTIVSSSPYPIHALVEVRDSALSFPPGEAGPRPVTFARKTTAREYKVTTRTSGNSRLDIVVRSPVGDVVLLSGAFTIRSTAVSGVAVTLSIGALLVLLVWWLRSVRRHRRIAAAARAGVGAGAE